MIGRSGRAIWVNVTHSPRSARMQVGHREGTPPKKRRKGGKAKRKKRTK